MAKRTPTVGLPLANRPPSDARPSRQRSAVTNGTRLFMAGDSESPWTRRFADLIELHLDDLGPRDRVSEAQRSIVRRAAAIEVELEQMEARMSCGEKVNLDLYQRTTNTLARALKTLGIERKGPRDVTPTLEELMDQRKQK